MNISIETLKHIAYRVSQVNPRKEDRADSFFYMLMGWVPSDEAQRIEALLLSDTETAPLPTSPLGCNTEASGRAATTGGTAPFLDMMS